MRAGETEEEESSRAREGERRLGQVAEDEGEANSVSFVSLLRER